MRALVLLVFVSIVSAQESPMERSAPSPQAQEKALKAISELSGRIVRDKEGKVSSVRLGTPFRASKVSDADLAHLKALPGLQSLWVNSPNVTDKGLVHLQGLTSLRLVSLRNTKVTDAGVKALQAALPMCKIDVGKPRPFGGVPGGVPRSRESRLPTSFTSYATTLRNRAQVLVMGIVRSELGLNAEQSKQIDDLLTAWSKQETETVKALSETKNPEEGRKLSGRSRESSTETLKKIQGILTAKQNTRLEQLMIQRSGFRVFVLIPRDVAEKLKIDAKQRARLREVYEGWEKENPLPVRGSQSWDRLMADMLAVFTEEQRRQWKEVVGAPFDFQARAPGRGPRVGTFTFPSLGAAAGLLNRVPVQQELGLTEEQRKKIAGLLYAWKAEENKVVEKLRGGKVGEELPQLRAGLSDLAIKTTQEMTEALTPEQKKRLDQLQLQRRGVFALLEASAVRQLKLTRQQQSQILRLYPQQAPGALGDKEREELMARVLKVLTDEQRQTWQSMTGKAFDFSGPAPRSATPSNPEEASEKGKTGP